MLGFKPHKLGCRILSGLHVSAAIARFNTNIVLDFYHLFQNVINFIEIIFRHKQSLLFLEPNIIFFHSKWV